ncbi:MAG: hypothetical protein ACRYGP_30790 [Janthinobacterium lividum]
MLSGATEREEPAPDKAAEPSIWDTLDDDDRASLMRALARSRAGIFASDEEVEAAFTTFGP